MILVDSEDMIYASIQDGIHHPSSRGDAEGTSNHRTIEELSAALRRRRLLAPPSLLPSSTSITSKK